MWARHIKMFWKPIVFSVVVLVVSLLSGKEVNKISLLEKNNMDKVFHFGLYFSFELLLLFDFKRLNLQGIRWKKLVFYSLAISISYGGIMELLQLIPYFQRDCSIYDFAANSTGAFVAVLLFRPVQWIVNGLYRYVTVLKQNYSL